MKRSKLLLASFVVLLGYRAYAQPDSPAPVVEKPAGDAATSGTRLNKIVVGYEYDAFNEGYQPWRQGFISYGRKLPFGSVIGRYNRANRFDTDGEQWEVDAYPRIREGTYAYLNYGHSNGNLFPKDRFAAELFQSLASGWEASLGFRRLDFAGGPVNLFTGSLVKYIGSYYLFLRPYYTPSELGPSSSLTVGMRYYLDDEQYLAASAGQGLSLQQDSSLRTVGLKSQKASVSAYLNLGADFFVTPGFAVIVDEVRAGVYRNEWAYDISVEKRF